MKDIVYQCAIHQTLIIAINLQFKKTCFFISIFLSFEYFHQKYFTLYKSCIIVYSEDYCKDIFVVGIKSLFPKEIKFILRIEIKFF